MKRILLSAALACASWLACGLAAAQPARPTPPVMRLGDAVRPLAYDVALTLLPDAPGFTGRVEIDIDIATPTDFFWLNGSGLRLGEASLSLGGRAVQATAFDGGNQFIGIRLGETVPAGRARLAITYAGDYATNETRGLFKQQSEGRWYAFSQFESINARRAIPCFDEPHWKTPWNVTLTVRADHAALSNTRETGQQPLPGGLKQVRFATTQPLPSYLVAFAAGPFDMVDGGTAGMNSVALRYAVPAGRAAELRFVRQATPRILELVESYFGRAYPYDKLDSVAIPITVGFGAMENPGLITYNSGLLLATPERDNERLQQRYVGTGAHEIAHQWFGNLVTMAWWDDLWLKESFATWMASKVSQQFNPAWDAHQRREWGRRAAFGTDRLASTRQVRQPVDTRDDLGNAYDRITYDKGGAVLTMFEGWLGEEAFREGVRRYMARHAHGNASAGDFFAAIGGAHPDIARAFTSFVSQPGLPLVDFELDCSGPQPAVMLRQQRFLPGGAAGNDQRWLVPVCLRHEGGETGKPLCTLLREREQRIELPGAKACPGWLLPNPGGTGYYLSRLGPKARKGLDRATLSAPEAASLLADQSLLAQSGALSVNELLALATPLAADPRPEVLGAVAAPVADIHPATLDPAGRDRLGRWVRTHLASRAAEAGWIPRPGETDATRSMRGVLLPLVADLGDDAELKAQARTLAQEWLAGERSRLGAMTRMVLKAAARDTDAPLFDAFVSAAQKAPDVATRIDILGSMGHMRDDAQRQRAFRFALSGGLDLRESSAILDSASEEPASATALLRFVTDNYDTLAKRLPQESLARIPRWHAGLCTAEGRQQLDRLYRPRVSLLSGAGRNLAQTLERVDLCVLARTAQASAATGN